jgi:PAS domain S-box-containing protein
MQEKVAGTEGRPARGSVRSLALGYGLAVVSVAAVTAVRLLLHPVLGDAAPLILFFLAVTVSAWYGGLGPGLLATALSAAAGSYFLLEPVDHVFSVTNPRDVLHLLLFVAMGLVITGLNQSLRSQVSERYRAEAESRAQAEALTEVIERLAQEPDLERLEGLVLAAIVNRFEASGGSLWTYDADSDEAGLVLQCQGGQVTAARTAPAFPFFEPGLLRETPGREELLAGLRRGECLVFAEVASDPRLSEEARVKMQQHGVRSVLLVPLMLRGRPIGYFSVRQARARSYAPGELELAQALAHQVTLATELTRLAAQARAAAVLQERECAAEERAAELEARVRERTAELEAATEALHQQAALIDTSHDALIMWELGGGICYWNRGAQELYGWKQEEVLGKGIQDLLRTRHPESIAALRAALARDGRWDGELIHTTRDGRELVIESRHVVLGTEEGRLLVLETNRDVTDRRQAEAALRESEGRYRQLSDELEQRVRERTAELARTVEALHAEMAEREEAERASEAQTHALARVLEQFTQEQRFEAFPGIVLSAIVEQFGASGGALWRYDEASESSERLLDCDEGRIIHGGDADHPYLNQRLEHRTYAGWALEKETYLRGECIVMSDLQAHPALDPVARAAYAARGITALLLVPLLLHGRLIGFYSLRSTREEQYRPRDFVLARALANQAALSLRISRLGQQAQEAAVLEERNRMAREIHDTLAQAFTGIVLQLGAAERLLAGDPQRGRGHLQSARELAREGLDEARRSAHALRPLALERRDLPGALATMAEQLSVDQQTQIRFQLRGEPRSLPPGVADHLLRIGQEAVTNALRHAAAVEVAVELSFTAAALHLSVRDDGRGLQARPRPPGDGIGLAGMRERAGEIGATLAIMSQAGEGTQVVVTWEFPGEGSASPAEGERSHDEPGKPDPDRPR